MSYFQNGNARIYYEDVGEGEPIIANHGLAEDTTYWSEPGVTAALAEKHRLISMDMRGHGRTVVEGEPKGYDEITMGNDFTALADHLQLGKFHLLSHATGGMVAARYGIRHSDRLLRNLPRVCFLKINLTLASGKSPFAESVMSPKPIMNGPIMCG